MLIQVTYLIKCPASARSKEATLPRTDFFECETMPDQSKIAEKLTKLRKNYLPGTIRISEWDFKSVQDARASGLTVTKL